MPVCSYLVIPDAGAGEELTRRLGELPGCDVTRAANRDVLLLVTDTPDAEADRTLRDRIEGLPGLRGLVLSFGEVDPETPQADPVREGRRAKESR